MTQTFYYYSNPTKRRKNRLSFAGIYNPETREVTIGIAQCNRKDTFIKKFGRKIAEERAVKRPYGDLTIEANEHPVKTFVGVCKELAKLPGIELFHKQ